MDDPLDLKLLMNQQHQSDSSTSYVKGIRCDICGAIYTDKGLFELHRQGHQKEPAMVQLVMNQNSQVIPQPAHQQGHTVSICTQDDQLNYKRNFEIDHQQMYTVAPISQYQVVSTNSRGTTVSIDQQQQQQIDIPYSPAYIVTTGPDGSAQLQPITEHIPGLRQEHISGLRQEHILMTQDQLEMMPQVTTSVSVQMEEPVPEPIISQSVIKVNKVPMYKKDRPYQCDQCTASFLDATEFEEHKSKHTGEGPFTCEDCHFTFMFKSHFRSHTTRCAKKRKLGMTSTTSTFVLDSTQTKHRFPKNYVKKHQPSQNSAQSNTSYGARQSGHSKKNGTSKRQDFNPKNPTFKRNKNGTRTGRPYECDECDASFQNESDLKNHKTKHTGEAPMTCDECKYVFLFRKLYEAHKRRCDKKKMQSQATENIATPNSLILESRSEMTDSMLQPTQIHLPDVHSLQQDNHNFVTLNPAMQVGGVQCQQSILGSAQEVTHVLPPHAIFDQVSMAQGTQLQGNCVSRPEIKYELVPASQAEIERMNVNQIMNLIKVKDATQ